MAGTPTEEQLAEKVPSLRDLFFSKFADTVSAGEAYAESDVTRIREDDRYVQCFMRAFQTDMTIEEPADNIDKVLRWRKEMKLEEFQEQNLPEDLRDSGYIYWSEKRDLQNRRILMLKVAKAIKGKYPEDTKRHIAYMMDQHHKVTPGDPDRVVFVFDFTKAGVSNVDLDVVKFIISALTNYFPSLLEHILLFEMPWLLGTVWKLIQTWLNEDQKKKIKQVDKSKITEYISQENLEPHMKK